MPSDQTQTSISSETAEVAPITGRLKIFLGYAPGVGKSQAMLQESLRRKKRGQDVVVGFVETARCDISDLISDFELVPPLKLDCQGTAIEELDLAAILKRKPGLVLVDDLAHENAPGAANCYRWQDVEQILQAGISVLTTLNVHNLESLKDIVEALTGFMPKETLPDRLLLEADEVEMVDVTPRALLHRLQRGDIYPKGDAPPIFSEEALSGLRELALREIAGRVDEDVEEYRKAHADARPWAVRDRVMICLTTSRPSLRLIRRGWRMAQRLHADAFCVYVEEQAPSEREKRLVQEGFNLAERLRMPTVKLAGRPLEKLVYFAREKNATHIVLGGSERSRWQEILHGSLINALTRELKNVDILIVAAEAESSGEH